MTSLHKKLVASSTELRGLVTQLEADQDEMDEVFDKLENHLQQIVICKRSNPRICDDFPDVKQLLLSALHQRVDGITRALLEVDRDLGDALRKIVVLCAEARQACAAVPIEQDVAVALRLRAASVGSLVSEIEVTASAHLKNLSGLMQQLRPERLIASREDEDISLKSLRSQVKMQPEDVRRIKYIVDCLLPS